MCGKLVTSVSPTNAGHELVYCNSLSRSDLPLACQQGETSFSNDFTFWHKNVASHLNNAVPRFSSRAASRAQEASACPVEQLNARVRCHHYGLFEDKRIHMSLFRKDASCLTICQPTPSSGAPGASLCDLLGRKRLKPLYCSLDKHVNCIPSTNGQALAWTHPLQCTSI